MMKSTLTSLIAIAIAASAGAKQAPTPAPIPPGVPVITIQPKAVTEVTKHDTDDPAIWIHPTDRAQSLVIGTDKDTDGALYVYDLQGKIVQDKVVRGLSRPNNVDLVQGFMLNGQKTDIAVVAERFSHRLRIYRLPDMAPVDAGGIPVFEGELARDIMGIALYTRASDGALFAIVSRSDFRAPRQGYLHQYRLIDDGNGVVRGVFTRAFGEWSGKKEIEAIGVDNELGYVYYSDETYGVRKYHADPTADDADEQLAEFALDTVTRDHEGISFYKINDGTGYILLSDQQANRFLIYTREGSPGNPHDHKLVKVVNVQAIDSDGSDTTNVSLPGFPSGLFVAMSTDKTFHYYSWDDIAGDDLKKAPNGVLATPKK